MLASIALAVLTFVSFRLHAGSSMAAVLFFFLIVLISLWTGLVSTVFACVLAALCFDYFFTQPPYRLRMSEPVEIAAMIAFTTTALIVSRLLSRVRERTADLQQINEQLWAEIFERRRAEERVRQKEEELRHLIDSIPAQIHAGLPNGDLDYFNQTWLNYVGLSLQDLQGWKWTAAIHPEDVAATVERWRASIATGEPFEHEARVRRADGEYRWMFHRKVALRDERGNVVRWYGTSIDIEERKRAEQRAREREAELRRLIDAIPQHVVVLEPDGSFLYVNQVALEYSGLTLEDSWGKDALAKIFHPGDLERVVGERQHAISRGVPWDAEVRIRRKDGNYRWFIIRLNPLRDEQGRILRWYGTRTDIEDRKRADEAVRQTQAELARVTRVVALGELAASIADEVNQPLSGVVVNANACLRWLAGDSPNLDEAREAVRRIVRDGKRAGDVIARIRALATKTAIAKERLDMNKAIREVMALAQDEVLRNRVTLRTELADDLSPVLGDRVQLQQVVLNLVMNGVEAMSSVEERPRELIVRTQNDDAGQVRVTVQDSGIGLDPQSLERIFDAFYTTKQGGMGMGLSISRSIIQNHGGKLWAVANEGPGMSVQFTIPKYQQ
jgi:PAS domain S-box-containing protein